VHADVAAAKFTHDPRHDLLEVVDERAAVGVAQGEVGCAPAFRRDQGSEGVIGIVLEAVEKVLGIVDDLPALGDEMAHRVLDHGEVFLGRGADDFGDMEQPRLADDGHDGSPGVEQHLELGVVGGGDAGAAGRPEGGDLGMTKFQPAHLGEERDIAGVGAGEAALDIVDAEMIQSFSDEELVSYGERYALTLGAVAEGGVVDFKRGVLHKKAPGFWPGALRVTWCLRCHLRHVAMPGPAADDNDRADDRNANDRVKQHDGW